MVRNRKREYNVEPYFPPEFAIRLGESRMEGFVDAYQLRQRFSAALDRSRPAPTLLDLAVSAYLQGIEDTVQSSVANGFDFGGEGAHLNRRSKVHKGNDGAGEGSVEGSDLEANRRLESNGVTTAPARADGPHSGFEEFAFEAESLATASLGWVCHPELGDGRGWGEAVLYLCPTCFEASVTNSLHRWRCLKNGCELRPGEPLAVPPEMKEIAERFFSHAGNVVQWKRPA